MTFSAAQSALDHAWHLVRRGEVSDAHFWASEASTLDPGLEEAWLILAATSDPNNSFEYLKKALDINPLSRRGNKGVVWAETKTGRSFEEYLATLHDFVPNLEKSNETSVYKPFEPSSTFPPADVLPPKVDSFSDFRQNMDSSRIADTSTQPKVEPQINSLQPTIIRRRRPRPRPPEPVNPWSVLLPYTVSFVIFLFLLTIWLLSGLPSVRAQSVASEGNTDELVSKILTANPRPTETKAPTITPSPTRTPTKIPTITLTSTPVPSQTVSSPTEEELDDGESESMPILIGDQIAETLEDGRWIEVDLAKQKVRAYARDSLLREFLVSTGTAAHPTVKGTYHIYIKKRYADMRGPGYYLPNVPYTMYFYQSYGLHGTYWHHNFGTPMSHGCVNLKTDDAAWLFQWASIGTLVYIH